jgi:hypothetical protein
MLQVVRRTVFAELIAYLCPVLRRRIFFGGGDFFKEKFRFVER